MMRFSTPPIGSTLQRELAKGRIWTRTGSAGKATMLWDRETRQYIVMTGHSGGERRFSTIILAVRHFRSAVGNWPIRDDM